MLGCWQMLSYFQQSCLPSSVWALNRKLRLIAGSGSLGLSHT